MARPHNLVVITAATESLSVSDVIQSLYRSENTGSGGLKLTAYVYDIWEEIGQPKTGEWMLLLEGSTELQTVSKLHDWIQNLHSKGASISKCSLLLERGQLVTGSGSGKVLFTAQIFIQPEYEAEFNDWCNDEHVLMLSRIPGWERSRRFVNETVGPALDDTNSTACDYWGIHDYGDKNALEGLSSEETKACVGTPWTQKMIGVMDKMTVKTWKLKQSVEVAT